MDITESNMFTCNNTYPIGDGRDEDDSCPRDTSYTDSEPKCDERTGNASPERIEITLLNSPFDQDVQSQDS